MQAVHSIGGPDRTDERERSRIPDLDLGFGGAGENVPSIRRHDEIVRRLSVGRCLLDRFEFQSRIVFQFASIRQCISVEVNMQDVEILS